MGVGNARGGHCGRGCGGGAVGWGRVARGGWTQRLLPRAGCTVLGALALLPFALNDLKKRDIQLTKADWGYFALLAGF